MRDRLSLSLRFPDRRRRDIINIAIVLIRVNVIIRAVSVVLWGGEDIDGLTTAFSLALIAPRIRLQTVDVEVFIPDRSQI